MRLDPTAVTARARHRQGVVRTAELLDWGADPSWIRRQVDSGRWQRLHRGVLLTHSGPVPWTTHAWAAVLYAGAGAAVSHRSAAVVFGWARARGGPIEVSVPRPRRVSATPGVLLHHRSTMPSVTGGLPTVVRQDTVVDLLSRARSDDEAVTWLCEAVRHGTWPDDVLDVLARRRRVGRRDLVVELLASVAEGVESALEHRYRRDVESAHGLPRGLLQQRQTVDGRWIRADCLYPACRVRVELDGRLAHPFGRTDDDTWRDNAVLVERGDLTLRYRWSHVAARPCRTAEQVAAALGSRGWNGRVRPCGPACRMRAVTS
ncbi:MAG: type IV toxin-antitoxin system AbiEi family antitoxin domain-containing protein [Actinotalea sp.]|nr:type IV toxin-antitoxin system AbiEi family antitoxin domain-containing protein [Actinotalea sp.]